MTTTLMLDGHLLSQSLQVVHWYNLCKTDSSAGISFLARPYARMTLPLATDGSH